MLRELRIKGLGIIEAISWTVEDGLNVITGETGAGKSLVIDAIEALVEGNASEEDIRTGVQEARVEGVFSIRSSSSPDLWQFLTEKGLMDDSGTLVISYDVRRRGRGVLRVNGSAVPRSILRQIAGMLIDIHGQSEHLSLLDKGTHIDYLDAYAHTVAAREHFRMLALELVTLEEELKKLMDKERERLSREEYLRYAIAEIERARLKMGEDEELGRELQVLSSVEELKRLSYQAYRLLYGEDGGLASASARDRLREAGHILKKLAEVDSAVVPKAEALETYMIEVEELARELYSYYENLEYDPGRLRTVEERLELISGLKRKYGGSIEQVLAYLNEARKELGELERLSEKRAEVERARALLRQKMGLLAHELSESRAKAAGRMMDHVRVELEALGLGGVEFVVSVARKMTDGGLLLPDGNSYAFHQDGVDNVEFLVSTNPGEPVRPLARIASAGEMSRFMLAIKSALGAVDKTPVLVFDEIDIGVGGRSGEVIGRKLWQLARNRQVICVTHLPQIAAFADAHYRVFKETREGRTLSILSRLDDESRVKELAAMLTG
ncbi:MAG: DNA repair protein RecN, partial [Dehalococcoidia bacterium]|nr:DNA repair protein RecN [Dehalococcoidia bacterium]